MRMSPKAHRSPTDLLWWSPNLFYACADSSKWGLFGRCARSAFRRTPSGRLIRSQLYLSCQIQKSGISYKLFGQFR